MSPKCGESPGNEFGRGKSWKLKFEVVESPAVSCGSN